jgi:hypothetical protein
LPTHRPQGPAAAKVFDGLKREHQRVLDEAMNVMLAVPQKPFNFSYFFIMR